MVVLCAFFVYVSVILYRLVYMLQVDKNQGVFLSNDQAVYH